MTCVKEFFKFSVPHGMWSGVCENFPHAEVSHEYAVLPELKGSYRANTVVSSIFSVGDTQLASATLYCTDSILFENDALDIWLYITSS